MDKRLQELDRCIEYILNTNVDECRSMSRLGVDLSDYVFDIRVKNSETLNLIGLDLEQRIRASLKLLGMDCYSIAFNNLSFEERYSTMNSGTIYLIVKMIFVVDVADGKKVKLLYERRVF